MNICPDLVVQAMSGWMVRAVLFAVFAASTFGQAPAITAPPLSKIAVVGQPVSFSVTATGAAPLSYQWKHRGQLLPGAGTQTLSLANPALADRGWYEVIVDNAQGSAKAVFWCDVVAAGGVAVPWGDNSAGQATLPTSLGPVLAVAGGEAHSLGLKPDGTVTGWGSNFYGQLSVPAGVTNVVALAASGRHNLALRDDGAIFAWGDLGQEGVPAGLAGVVAIATGWRHNLAVRSDGTVAAWGDNNYGQCNVPGDLSGVVAVAGGGWHTLALKGDGTVAAWGLNANGQASVPAGLNGVVAIAAGQYHSLALKADGSVVAWGWGSAGATTVPPGLGGVVAVAAGDSHSLAVKADGTVSAWGSNSYGQTDIPTSLMAVSTAVAGFRHSVAIMVPQPLTIAVQPASQAVFATTSAILTVVPSGTPPFTFQWLRGSASLSDGDRVTGSRSASLMVSPVDFSDAATYAVIVSDRSGSVTSANAVLTVSAAVAPANDNFAAAQVITGASGSITGTNAAASGEIGEPTHLYLNTQTNSSSVWYTWTAPRSGGVTFSASGPGFRPVVAAYSGNAVSSLVSNGYAAAARTSAIVQAGTTVRIAISSADSIRGSFALEWQLDSAPENDDLANAQVLSGREGSVAGTNAKATGETGEPPHYEGVGATSSLWYRWTATANGVAVFQTEAHFYSEILAVYSGSSYANLVRLGQSAGLAGYAHANVILPVTAGTTYSIVVASHFDNRGSFDLKWELQTPPAISSGVANQIAAVGGSATFTVVADGGGLTYQWFHDGVLLPGATGASLPFGTLTLFDAGTYQVRIKNLAGSLLSTVAVLSGPNPSPVISTQPGSTTATTGQPVTLSVVATGVGPLTYQWRRNGLPIRGAMAAGYSIAAPVASDADLYDVIVYDGLSATTSQLVRLIVKPQGYPGLQSRVAGNDLVPETDVTDPVKLLVPGPGGKIYLAGPFRAIGGRWRSGFARLNADLTHDAAYLPPVIDGTVTAIAPLANGKVWIAGQFATIDGQARGNVVRLNADGSLDTTITAAASEWGGTITAVAVLGDGRVVLGGAPLTITSFGYQFTGVMGVLNFDGTAEFISAPATLGSSVRAMAMQADGKILVGSDSPDVRSPSGNGIIRLNADGSIDGSFTPVDVVSPTGSVAALAVQPDGKILVAGRLDSYVHVRRLRPNGQLDATFAGSPEFLPEGSIRTMIVQPGGKIIIGGSQLALIGGPYLNLVRLNPDGSVDASLASAPNATVTTAVVAGDGGMLVGGSFDHVGAMERNGFAKLNADGALDGTYSVAPRHVGAINALADLPGGAVLVGGDFSYFGGIPAERIARIEADGTANAAFNAGKGPNGPVYTMVPQADGRVVLFGWFSSYAGTARSCLARINPDGSLDPDYNIPISDGSQILPARTRGRSIRLSRDRILFPVYYLLRWGVPTNGLALLNPDGSRDSTFDIGAGVNAGSVYALAVQPDGKIIIGGELTTFNNQPCQRLVRLNADGSRDSSFDPGTGPNDAVKAVTLQPDGKILIEGAFTFCNGTARKYVARLNPNGSLDESFVPAEPDAAADGAILQADGRVIIFGDFTTVGAQRNSRYIARLNADGSVDPSFQVHGLESRLTALLLYGDGQLYAGSATDGLMRFQTATMPAISAQPVTVVAAPGETAQFSVTAGGTAPLTYQWYFNGVSIPGATAAVFTVANAQLAQAGRYSVVVSNVFGSAASDDVMLKGPNPLPLITTQPSAPATLAGQNVTLRVMATTTGTAAYQWRREGVAIPGATGSTLDLGPASLVQNGVRYDVLVSDGLSLTISEPVSISVAPASYPEVVQPDPNFGPSFDTKGGRISQFHRLADGRVYVTGSFSRLGGHRGWNIARLTAAGTVDPTFVGPITDGPIWSLDVQGDGSIIIAGSFRRINGQPRDGLARLTAAGQLDEAFLADVRADDYDVTAVHVQTDGRILVGAGANPGLIRLNADGSRDGSFFNMSLVGLVYDLAIQADGKIVAGGSFSGPGGLIYNYLARLNPDGALDPGFNPGSGPNFTVTQVRILGDGRILAGGHFRSYNGTAIGGLVRLTTGGAIDPTWSQAAGFETLTFDAGVDSLELLPDGRILAAGNFYRYNGSTRHQMARLLPDGGLDGTFSPPVPTRGANAITYLSSGDVLVGGSDVTVLTDNGASHTTALTDSLFSPAPVRLLPLAGGKFIATGAFGYVNGTGSGGLVRVDATGLVDPAFNTGGTGPSSLVRGGVLQPDGRIVIAGDFTTYNGVAQAYLARLNSDGSLDGSFQPATSGLVLDGYARLHPLRGGRMLLYCLSNVQPHFLLLNADGSTAASFAAPQAISINSAVSEVAEQADGRLVLVGSFSSLSNAAAERIVRLMPNGVRDAAFEASADGDINAVKILPGGKMIVGGDFLSINGTPCPRLARLNDDGSVDPTFAPGFGPNRAVRQILLQPDGRFLISGWFTAVNGAANTAFVARLLADGAVDSTFAGRDINGGPSQMEMQDDGSLLLSGGYNEIGSYQQFGVIRTVSAAGPVIARQPQPATLLAGTPLALSAAVLGGGQVSYQWLRNGSPVSGATTLQYAVASAQAGDAGGYTLQVTSDAGTQTTNPAAVVVTASPPVFASSPGSIGGFGGAIALGSRWPLGAPALAAGSAPLSFQWFKNGTAIPGGTARTYLVEWLPQDEGNYSVVVTNGLGSIQSGGFSQQVTGTRDWMWTHPLPQGNPLNTVAFANGRFLAGGARGTILTSTDGVAWAVRRLDISESVFGFAAGDSGFVALSSFGGIWHSSDAATWVRGDSSIGEDGRYLAAIAFGGGRFVAVGSKGLVAYSSDGLAWSTTSMGTGDQLTAIAYGGGKFIALGGGGRTYLSGDGASWSAGAVLPAETSGIAYGAGRFVVAGGGAGFASVDGATWNEWTISRLASVRAIQFSDGKFLALLTDTTPSGHFAISTDGIAWSEQSFSTVYNGSLGVPTALAFGAGHYVVVSADADVMLTSTDGLLWSRPGLGGSSDVAFTSIAASDSQVVVAGFKDYHGRTWSSSDGNQWVESNTEAVNGFYGVAYGTGRFVAVGGVGEIRVKPDGGSWSDASSGTNRSLYGVSFVDNRFIAVGSGGTLLSSTDGTAWTAGSTGVTQSLYKVAYGVGTYVAVGASGTVLSSTDRAAWIVRNAGGISSDIDAVAFGAGKFVLVSEGGSIRTSTDGVTWLAQNNPLGFGLRTVVFAAGRFYAFSTGNTDYLSSEDGVSWKIAQNGSVNAIFDAARMGDRLYAVGDNTSILSTSVAAVVPLITSQSMAEVTDLGGNVTLSVAASGSPALSYQWRKNGVSIPGATGASYTISAAQLADAGTYSVLISNSAGTAVSAPISVAVMPGGARASHAVASLVYTAGGTATITNTVAYAGSLTQLGWQVLLPEGWSFASGTGPAATTSPTAGATSLLEWTWTTVPPSPVVFTYTVNVPANAKGDYPVAALVTVQSAGGSAQATVRPDPLMLRDVWVHSADTDHNFRLSLKELLRVIELYNTRNGTVRTGCYAVDPTNTEDGFMGAPERSAGAGVTLATYHSADADRNGRLELKELLRVIELYNYRSGTERTGQYHARAGTEDGFDPGP